MFALTRCVCTIATSIHFVYGNHNSKAQAVSVVQGFKMVGANSHVRPNALRLHNRYIYPFRLW